MCTAEEKAGLSTTSTRMKALGEFVVRKGSATTADNSFPFSVTSYKGIINKYVIIQLTKPLSKKGLPRKSS